MATLAAALFTGLVSISQAQPVQPPATGSNRPLSVTVNGEVQPAEWGEILLREQLARGVADTPQLQSLLRETLINQGLMAQEAVKTGLDKQTMVRARLNLVRQSALAQAWQQQVLQSVQISNADVQTEYDRQVQVLGTQAVRLRHVLLADEKLAQQVQEKLKGGAQFEVVAAEASQDASTRERGGLSDWVPEGNLEPGIAKAVLGLQDGQLASAPVQTASGWQVLRLEGRRPFTAPSIDTVKPQLRRALEQRALQARLKALRESARVK